MADTTVARRLTPDQIENVRLVTQQGKLASALLIILMGTAAALSSVDARATAPSIQVSSERQVGAWKGNPLLTIISSYPDDIVHSFDNFEGWPPPEPPFVQQQTHLPLVVSQTSYNPYAPATDVISGAFRRKPDYQIPPDFLLQRQGYLLTALVKNPAPAGDLTTQLRRQPFFADVESFIQPDKGAWHVTLMPQLAPPPVIPIPPTDGTWPPPPSVTNLPGRGAWELPGGKQAIWVIGSGCFLMTVKAPATASSEAVFNIQRVGTLASSTGPVGIRDNGPGGFVAIVDGPNGYFYEIATRKFTRITDPAFLGATHVAFIDGWWIFNQPNSQTFYVPQSTYSTVFNASNFALKDGATDLLEALIENKEELWLIGGKTTEIWYDAGGQYFPFQRLVSTMLQVGISAKYSLARYAAGGQTGLVWLARSERGQNVVVKTEAFETVTISTPAVANEIAKYTVISDAVGYVYEDDGGHEFYMLTFPTMDKTWTYDFATNFWHERASFDPYAGLFHRHRSSCYLNFQDQRLVADYQNGAIHRMTREAYTDAGWPLVALRRTPHVWDGDNRDRVFGMQLQVDIAPGTGNQSGLGYDPKLSLRISRDAGKTWGIELVRSIGRIGQYLTRVIFRRLGFARDTVYEVKVVDPVPRDITSATLKNSNGG